MTFPIKITDDPLDTDILYNNYWKAVITYVHSTNSEFYGNAFVYTLDKRVTDSANEAFVYLLQRSIIEEEGWTEKSMAEITAEQLASFILSCGYLHTPKGTYISIEDFWKNYMGFINDMQKEASYTLSKNDEPIPALDLEFHEEPYIIAATSFINVWNDQQYFFETWTHWVFFRWGTGV